jgi:hypothetical protein
VGDPAAVCGGVIGAADNQKFCAVHPSLCDYQTTHLGKKFELATDSLYVMSPKKGSLHATLVPRLPRNCIPKNMALEELLNEERPVSMWHVCFNECNASEEATGDNELGTISEVSWEAIERPSLDSLERANDFKTPKKVKVNQVFMNKEHNGPEKLLEYVIPLDLKDIPVDEGDESQVQKTIRQMFIGWQVLTRNFSALNLWTKDQEEEASGVRTHLQELVTYLNDVGAKTRLLSAKIGQNPRAAEEGEPTLWEALAELNAEFKAMKLAVEKLPQGLKEVWDTLDKHGSGMRKMESNMTAMCSHCKNCLSCANKRMTALEKSASAGRHAPRPQAQEGVFDFEPSSNDGGEDVRDEIRQMKAEIEALRKPTTHQAGNPMIPVCFVFDLVLRGAERSR